MQQQHHPLLSASLGTQREIISFHFGEGHEKQVYIQAALHGDETPGIAVAWFLKKRLKALEAAGKLQAVVTLVPVCNPMGLSQHWHGTQLGRFHMPSGQDFNRKFPAPGNALIDILADRLTDNEAENKRLIREELDRYYRELVPTSELESQRFTLMRMASQADLMIDMHCDWEALPHLYTMPHAWDDIAPLARWVGTDVQLLAEISGGEPFDESCCEPWQTLQNHFADRYPMPRGLLPVTLELRGMADVSAEQAEQDADAIINTLIAGGYIAGELAEAPPLRNAATPLAGCEYIYAPHSGVLLHRRELGSRIQPGDVVAEIIDPLTDRCTPVVAEFGGILYARNWNKFVTAGALTVRMAGENVVRSGDLLVG